MAQIELRNVSKRYAGTSAVRGASFTIQDGEFFILVGPSGCGKSSLLNMIVGLEEPSGGEIRVDGSCVNGLDPRERNMAMVFQSYAIYPHMTVRENMAFPLKLAKLPKTEIDRRVTEAARVLQLGDVLERKPRALSGGQRQRVAMGRAIVREPGVFLLDEPLSNLDARLRVQMRTEIARLQRRLGTTTLYVTHDQTEAMTLGDRIAVLQGGEIQQIGTPRELYERPANLFVAGFIGSPAMNFVPARHRDGHLELPLGLIEPAGGMRAALEAAGQALVVGFRPDHLCLAQGAGGEALAFQAQVEVVEWLGSDQFVYFDVPLEGFDAAGLPGDAGINSGAPTRCSLAARIDCATPVREGEVLCLQLRTSQLQVFDAASGVNLSRGQLSVK